LCPGLITFYKPKEADDPFLLWEDDSGLTEKSNHLTYILAPEQKLPDIELSFSFK
ncbi:hypothetical protein RYX36_002581, partial [Vicia faba]